MSRLIQDGGGVVEDDLLLAVEGVDFQHFIGDRNAFANGAGQRPVVGSDLLPGREAAGFENTIIAGSDPWFGAPDGHARLIRPENLAVFVEKPYTDGEDVEDLFQSAFLAVQGLFRFLEAGDVDDLGDEMGGLSC